MARQTSSKEDLLEVQSLRNEPSSRSLFRLFDMPSLNLGLGVGLSWLDSFRPAFPFLQEFELIRASILTPSTLDQTVEARVYQSRCNPSDPLMIYFPLNTAGRFSLKANKPSSLSCVFSKVL